MHGTEELWWLPVLWTLLLQVPAPFRSWHFAQTMFVELIPLAFPLTMYAVFQSTLYSVSSSHCAVDPCGPDAWPTVSFEWQSVHVSMLLIVSPLVRKLAAEGSDQVCVRVVPPASLKVNALCRPTVWPRTLCTLTLLGLNSWATFD